MKLKRAIKKLNGNLGYVQWHELAREALRAGAKQRKVKGEWIWYCPKGKEDKEI